MTLDGVGRKMAAAGVCVAFLGLILLPLAVLVFGGVSRQAAPVLFCWISWTGALILGGIALQQIAEGRSSKGGK